MIETTTAVDDTITTTPQPILKENEFSLVCASSFRGTLSYHCVPNGGNLSVSIQFLTCLTLFSSPPRARKLGTGLPT
jgi:hypothetical protein